MYIPPRPLFAIAAMGENRVIGNANRLPWHFPEDFRFFKKTTLGNVLVMGRKTYESIGRPLPGRTTVVLTRSGAAIPGVVTLSSWDEVWAVEPEKKLFLAGGAALYAEALPWCTGLYLTHVHAAPEGDAFFPAFESWFDAGEIIETFPNFTICYHGRLDRSFHPCIPC
ncbi:MAG: dihydrofolate reductase [Puniceicoccales bacterium]|jgi:dihydrofolate reductase|nr:dihydrofolate reductase [Puniceicoccales bacterium]